MKKRIAIIIPCTNNESTIGSIIDDCRLSIPFADIIICDNNCTDNTVKIAELYNVEILENDSFDRREVIKSMFAYCYMRNYDYIALVEPNEPFDLRGLKQEYKLMIRENYDMLVGIRSNSKFEPLIKGMAKKLIRCHPNIEDPLSTYRIFSRRFIGSYCPIESDIPLEIDLNINAVKSGLSIASIPVLYNKKVKRLRIRDILALRREIKKFI